WLQFDCALSYGLCEYQRTLGVLQTHGWSASRCIPHGGHQMSLNIAAGLGLGGNESYPDLFQPYGGFPDGVRVENGHITMPDLPGIGFEGKTDLYAEMKRLAGLGGRVGRRAPSLRAKRRHPVGSGRDSELHRRCNASHQGCGLASVRSAARS